MGEFIAWTLIRNGRPSLAMKHYKDASSIAPNLLGTQFAAAYFCELDRRGDMLANVKGTDGKWKLVILDRRGDLKSELGVDPRPRRARSRRGGNTSTASVTASLAYASDADHGYIHRPWGNHLRYHRARGTIRMKRI